MNITISTLLLGLTLQSQSEATQPQFIEVHAPPGSVQIPECQIQLKMLYGNTPPVPQLWLQVNEGDRQFQDAISGPWGQPTWDAFCNTTVNLTRSGTNVLRFTACNGTEETSTNIEVVLDVPAPEVRLPGEFDNGVCQLSCPQALSHAVIPLENANISLNWQVNGGPVQTTCAPANVGTNSEFELPLQFAPGITNTLQIWTVEGTNLTSVTNQYLAYVQQPELGFQWMLPNPPKPGTSCITNRSGCSQTSVQVACPNNLNLNWLLNYQINQGPVISITNSGWPGYCTAQLMPNLGSNTIKFWADLDDGNSTPVYNFSFYQSPTTDIIPSTISVARTGTNQVVTVTFPVSEGKNYAVESTTSLSATATWTDLPGAPHNAGTATCTNSESMRFYRVRVQP